MIDRTEPLLLAVCFNDPDTCIYKTYRTFIECGNSGLGCKIYNEERKEGG